MQSKNFTLSKGRGLHICEMGNPELKTIDIIVRDINGKAGARKAELEVRGVDGLEHVALDSFYRTYSISYEVRLQLKRVTGKGRAVLLQVEVDSGYAVTTRPYR